MKIDIVVPIYNAYNALLNCLKSLEKHQQGADNIILINDASTDERVKPLLEQVSKKNHWQLIQHIKNQGFVKTANEGLAQNNHHTILLNSDTIVSKNWISAFKQAIQSNDRLATATAWSNNAEICSFPQFLTNNAIPKNIDQFSEILYKNHKPQYPVIPTAVGFCMLITQLAKQKVGTFDEERFGHGYGEENDYSLRATELGLLNVICDNAYVVHVGNESFSDLGLQPDENSMQRLLGKHPNYLTMIQSYIEQDPLNALRSEILNTIKENDRNLYHAISIDNKNKTEKPQMEKEKLEFTGERFTPECVREIWYEHYHRYAYAQRLVKNKIVLDAACGEGYGTDMLAQHAKQAYGIDIDQKTIKHSQSRYNRENLQFQQGSCTDLPFENNTFDVVISFETLEHLAEQSQMLEEFDRVLKKDGVLVISTPDKKHYSDATGFQNEYHVKELYQGEFKALLDQHWQYQIWYSQSLAFHSVMEKIDAPEMSYATDILHEDTLQSDENMLKSMYYIVLASKKKRYLPKAPALHLFADKQQSVYEHYNQTIRDYISVAEKYMAMKEKHEKWLSHPILSRIIKFLERGK